MILNFNRYQDQVQRLSLIIILGLLFSITGGFFIKVAKAANITWAITDFYNNEYLEYKSTTDVQIVFRGYHSKKTNENYYKTDDYVMTLRPYAVSGKFPIEARSNRINVKKVDVISPDPSTVITDYYIKFEDIIGMAGKLGITGETIGNGTVPVYFHVIYDIYKGDNLVVNDIIGCQEMLNAPVKYRLGYTEWSDGTQDKIPSFYNMRIDLTATCTYNVKIVPVDENNKVIKNATDKNGNNVKYDGFPKRIIYKNDVTYSISSSNKEIKSNNDKYTYNNKWYYEYEKRKTGLTVTTNHNSGTTVSFEAPDATPGSTLTIYMQYKKANTPSTPTPVPGKPTPTSAPSGPTPTPTLPQIIPPEPDEAYMDFTEVTATGIIKADNRGAERFTSTLGVPTVESLFGEVTATQYLLGYRFIKKVGIEYYNVKVSKEYHLQWYSATPDDSGGAVLIEDTVMVEQTISVPRAYGYWEIENLECYKIDNAKLRNYALPNEIITVYPNYSYYSPPSVNVSHTSDKSYHIIPPVEAVQGIRLPKQTISNASNPTKKPTIPKESFSYYALSQTGEVKVRSDSLSFNGRTVISNSISNTNAPDINTSFIPQCYDLTNSNTLYEPNNIIEATKSNGTYPSSGMITYTAVAKVGSAKMNNLQYSIDGVNKVVIHTPVVCVPSITADNNKYVQLINPSSGCVQLVLDPDPTLSDFIVHISNTELHSNKQGYYTRDFSRTLREPSLSYISSDNGLLKNQVKFPFDVYRDKGVAYDCRDDEFIRAGTWLTIDRSSPRFYLPMTVNEGDYTVQFRTIAINGEAFLAKTEEFANTNLINYVATETINVEVSGRMYGLKVYDLSDYPTWEETFRIPKSMDFKKDSSIYPDGTAHTTYSPGRSYQYTLGTNDQYGNDTGRNNKFTFPLVNGSHPKYKTAGILKPGYLVRFSLNTTGNMFADNCKISILPNFYFVDSNGKNRKAVDLYYSEDFNKKTQQLVKVGSKKDQTNLKTYSTGDLSLGIPKWELKQTAALRGMTYSKFSSGRSAMFNFSEIRLNYAFRTYINNAYTSKVKSYSSYTKVVEKGIKEGDILERMQTWYGQYYVPNNVHVVKQGFNVMDYSDKYGIDYSEDFWLKDGYIIVNFTIETIDENGNRRLSYINPENYKDKGNCSMWIMEGPVTSKQSYKGPEFHFYPGDFVVYYANKRMSDDYKQGAIY